MGLVKGFVTFEVDEKIGMVSYDIVDLIDHIKMDLSELGEEIIAIYELLVKWIFKLDEEWTGCGGVGV
jgi:hypothetical protein